jgi:hypothetical protein
VRSRIAIGENVESKKPKTPPDDPEESARFMETAKQIEADTSGNAFARAFKKIVPKKKVQRQP